MPLDIKSAAVNMSSTISENVSKAVSGIQQVVSDQNAQDSRGSQNAPWTGGSSKFKNPSCFDNGNFLWAFLTAYPNNQKTSIAQLQTINPPADTSKVLATFQFLMGDDLNLNMNHIWDKASDFVSKGAQKLVEGANTAQGLIKAGSSIENMIDTFQNGQANIDTAIKALKSASSQNHGKYKMDEAQLYSNSEPQSTTLSFVLGVGKSESSGKSYAEKLYSEIVLPVNSLLWCSSALSKNTFGIEYPAIFDVKIAASGSKPLLHIKYAYLSSVQPTYNAPWVDGQPTTCNLSLTFTSLMPTYKQTFEYGGF